ncbi:MAG: type IX secretion system membrane protein PorP/SprF [Bacteroidota bacterium]
MRKNYTLAALLLLIAVGANAQQDAMFTKYMFNSLAYNPAYAGSKEHMSIALLHRTQWWGISGGPSTQSFTIHSPMRNKRVGLGFSAINDVIGPTNTMQANVSYAYRLPIGKGKLAVGLQGGILNWRADWDELDLQDNTDDAFAEMEPSYWLPNFGAGIYYYTNNFYMGFSAPQLIEYDLREENINTAQWSKQYRHYYFATGAAIPVSGDAIIFKPSILIKNVGLLSTLSKDEAYQNVGAPTEFDVDISFLFYNALWVGASFRSSIEAFTDDSSSFDSVDAWASYYLANGLRIGAAFDYTLTPLQDVARGSFEVMLGYEFNYVTRQIVTPRYF